MPDSLAHRLRAAKFGEEQSLERQALVTAAEETGAVASLVRTNIAIDGVSLAFDETAGTLYGILTNTVVTIDLETGMVEAVGPHSLVPAPTSLAFDTRSGRLFTASGGSLASLDPATGASTVVGTLTGPSQPYGVQGLAFDRVSGVLLGVDVGENLMVEIDPVTAAVDDLGSISSGVVSSLGGVLR